MENITFDNKEKLEKLKELTPKALKALGKDNFSFIVHGASFPSEIGLDTGIGSFLSQGAISLYDFLSDMFSSIQLGPEGKTKAVDASPYTGTIFSSNPLFIDLSTLASCSFANILSIETLNDIIENNPNKNQNKVAYSYIFAKQEEALKEAFYNFQNKLNNKDSLSPEDKKIIEKIQKNFQKFVKDNENWLEKDALYEALSVKYKNDYWPLWTDELDKNLFNPQNEEEQKQANQRIDDLKKEYADTIDFYNFCQFIIFEQKQEIRKCTDSKNLKLIADRQVAFSDRDVWAYKSLFLKDWALGVPPDYFCADGQAWGFPVLNPDKLFNEDGTLGDAGKLLQSLYKKMFKENSGGIRIDHLVGLIDPWVYKKGKTPKIEDGAGRLFSSPEHPELSKYAIATIDDLDFELEADKEYRIKQLNDEQVAKYARIIEKIILPAAKEVGLTNQSIICEDLGTVTYPVERVIEMYNLFGMKLTQFVAPEKEEHPYRCCNMPNDAWCMVGTHDNEPIERWANCLMNTHEGYLHAKNLAEDLIPEEREFQREEMTYKMSTDANLLRKFKLAEIFAAKTKNVQVFFTDFLGIDDVYNKPGTSGDKNWSLRVPDNFEDFYFEQLKKDKGLNLPEILRIAMEARGKDFVLKNKDLINQLEDLENILKN